MKTWKRLATVVELVAWFFVEGVKDAMDDAMRRQVEGVCTRKAPHHCRVDGPCNGYPRK